TSPSTGNRATLYGSTGPRSRSPWMSSRRRDAPSLTNSPTRQTSSSRTLDRRFASNTLRVAHRDELTTIIAERFAAVPTENLESKLQAARVAFAGVNTVPELHDHPVLRGRDRWRTVQTEAGGIEALLPPLDFGGEVRMDPVPA